MQPYIYFKKKKYYYYDTYLTWKTAYADARYWKNENGSRYFILITEGGFWIPIKRYHLYLDRVMNRI